MGEVAWVMPLGVSLNRCSILFYSSQDLKVVDLPKMWENLQLRGNASGTHTLAILNPFHTNMIGG
jgi:hypothetical protein